MFEAPDFVINLHGIGNPTRVYEPGEEEYWISEIEFEKLLNLIATDSSSAKIGLTFDDGNISDYLIAAPQLRVRELGATFFVLAGKIGSNGYLHEHHIKQLFREGFEIGSHGMNHIAWTDLSVSELRWELKQSRAILEVATGGKIDSVSIPFGAYNGNVIRELRRHGYRNIFSSDGRMRLTSAIPIPRFTVKRGLEATSLSRELREAVGLRSRMMTELRVRLKSAR